MLHQSQCQVPLAAADSPGRLGQRHVRGTEQRPGIALAERGQPLQLGHRLERQGRERHFGIDRQFGQLRLSGERRADRFTKRRPKPGHPVFGNLQAGRRGMPPVSDQILVALGQHGVQVEPGNARAEPTAGLIPSSSRAMRTTGRWNFSASRPATIPITPGCQPRPASTRRIAGDVEFVLGLLVGRQ